MQVGALNATLGLVTNRDEWKRGEAQINHFRRLALGVSAYFGGKWLGGALLGFNREVEDAKNQIAGMMAFAKKTLVTDELANANTLYDKLREKAMDLPGETADYVKMLGMITQPLTEAGASLDQMADFTANAFVLSKGLGENWAKSSRDIREFINFGRINAVDTFLRTAMTGTDIDATDKGRANAKKLGKAGRMQKLAEQLGSPTVKSIGDQYSKSMSGRIERVRDTIKQTMGKAGEALFSSVKDSLDKLAVWLKANQEKITGWAKTAGEYINTAFLGMRDGLMWLVDHKDIVVSALVAVGGAFAVLALRAMAAWAATFWPVIAGAGFVYIFLQLREHVGDLAAAFITLYTVVAAVFIGKRVMDFVKGIRAATAATTQLAMAQAATGKVAPWSAASNAINTNGIQLGSGIIAGNNGLGPAGAGARAGTPGMGVLPALGAATGIMLAAQLADGIIDGLQDPDTTARGNATISELWKTMDISKAMKKGENFTLEDNREINITVQGGDKATAEAVKKAVEETDAQQRSAHRYLAGNRGGDGT